VPAPPPDPGEPPPAFPPLEPQPASVKTNASAPIRARQERVVSDCFAIFTSVRRLLRRHKPRAAGQSARRNASSAARSAFDNAAGRAPFSGAWTADASGSVRRRTSSSVGALPSLK